MCVCESAGVARASGVHAPPLAGSRGRPGLRAPCGRAEHMEEMGWGWDSAGSRTARAVRGWLERTDWLVVGRAHSDSLTCSLACSL